MADSINIAEAKAKFSNLVERAAGGEEIVITRAGKPRARIVPLAKLPKRPFGIAKHWPKIPDEVLLAPMSEEDVRWAEGYYNDEYGMTKPEYLSKSKVDKKAMKAWRKRWPTKPTVTRKK
jgi:prevent-host-death family protein